MCDLPTSMYVHHMCVLCQQRQVSRSHFPKLELQKVVNCHVGVRLILSPESFAKATSALNYLPISPACKLFFSINLLLYELAT